MLGMNLSPLDRRGFVLTLYSSHVEITPEHHGNLFFWHYQNRHIANKQRTVLWLNGGPGCSSMDGALMEIGPYRVLENGNLAYNNGSWAEFANLLFVDQPVGTGFSYVDTDSYLHELSDASNQMVQFLEKFYTMFPEYANDDVSMSLSVCHIQSLTTFSSTSQVNRMPASTFLIWPKPSSSATPRPRPRNGTSPVSSSATDGSRQSTNPSRTFPTQKRTACSKTAPTTQRGSKPSTQSVYKTSTRVEKITSMCHPANSSCKKSSESAIKRTANASTCTMYVWTTHTRVAA
jgi:hypothetical protein